MQTNACFNQDISNLTSFSLVFILLFYLFFVNFRFYIIIIHWGLLSFIVLELKDRTILTWSERVTSLSVYECWMVAPRAKKPKTKTKKKLLNNVLHSHTCREEY